MKPLTNAIVELARQAGDRGVAMGALVDTLERQGFSAGDVELEVWRLLGERRLTPSGFICRTMRRHGQGNGRDTMRMYEFTLVPWSSELDQQLELSLEGR